MPPEGPPRRPNPYETRENPTCPRCKGAKTIKNDQGKDVTCPGCGGSGKVY